MGDRPANPLSKCVVHLVLLLTLPWILPEVARAADPLVVELTTDTRHLVDLIREGAEEAGVTSLPSWSAPTAMRTDSGGMSDAKPMRRWFHLLQLDQEALCGTT